MNANSTIKLSEATLRAGMRIYAIGDVHGCLVELKNLIEQIRLDLKNNPPETYKIIFLGDYIDRGPDSRGCVELLINMLDTDQNVICLGGNHEAKLLEFLEHPRKLADSFFRYGGKELCKSYGLQTKGLTRDPVLAASSLLEAIQGAHFDFYLRLKTSVVVDDYLFVHAGIRPGVALKDQTRHDMQWIRYEFIDCDDLFEKVVVHGHTPGPKPEIKDNRINVDTRAYDTGVLTSVVLEGNSYRFLNTQ